jgi:hypothetical protein
MNLFLKANFSIKMLPPLNSKRVYQELAFALWLSEAS